jgi:sporulation protein YqfD
MKELEYIFLGYIKIEVDSEDFYKVMSLFLGKGILAFSKVKGEIFVFYNQRKLAIELLENAKITYLLAKEFNLLQFEKDKTNAVILISAILFSLVFTFFLSNLVWRIEVDGCKNISKSELISSLEECGLEIGAMWQGIDFGDVENSVLNKLPQIAWINVNRVGTVAFVSIIEADSQTPDSEKYKYSNIVASEDCIVESISVTTGTPMVKIGDAVTKGDLLILGINSTQDESVPCKAEGEIIGRVNKRISVTVSRKNMEKIEKNRTLAALKIKIFDFSINIFKKYRNLDTECAIIEENGQISLFDGTALPIFIEKQYTVEYEYSSYDLHDDDLIASASELMRQKIEHILADVRLNSIKTYGNFTDEGYVMHTEMVYLCDVCEDAEFFISEEQKE